MVYGKQTLDLGPFESNIHPSKLIGTIVETTNVNKAVISAQDQIGFLLNQHIRGALEVVRLYRETNENWLSTIYQDAVKSNFTYKYFRDFATVRLSFPQRSGVTTWCQKGLDANDLFISGVNWNPKSFKCQVSKLELNEVDKENPPSLIVIDNASYMGEEFITRVYKELGKDPRRQTFLLLG